MIVEIIEGIEMMMTIETMTINKWNSNPFSDHKRSAPAHPPLRRLVL